jgi:dihydroorotate dehydrogenase
MYKFLVSLLFLFVKDPETAHQGALLFLKIIGIPFVRNGVSFLASVKNPALSQTVFGIEFPAPVGLAAGFDKDGSALNGLEALGFGHVEVGTVTKYPQEGNPRQRLFRFNDDKAIINRMGFNNAGAGALSRKLIGKTHRVPIGISLGKSKRAELEEAPQDYRFSLERLYDMGDYFVINVSSPNTPGLRELQDKKHLIDIVNMMDEYRRLQQKRKPFLVKIAPDLSYEAIDEVLEVCEKFNIDGVIAVNTTVARVGVSKAATETAGGLSGEPIRKRATEIIRHIHRKKPNLPIIGVGGIFTAEDAYEKIKAGASLVQVYTGFIFEGPLIARSIHARLLELLELDGYSNIREAVGKD